MLLDDNLYVFDIIVYEIKYHDVFDEYSDDEHNGIF